MRQPFTATLCCLTFSLMNAPLTLAAGTTGTSPWQSPNWDRDLALMATWQVDTDSETQRLVNLAKHGSSAVLLQSLRQLTSRPDWPAPARESALFQFINALRETPAFSVEPVVLDFLLAHRNQTLVAHEEASGQSVPMYPIQAATHGLIHQWTRKQAKLDASTLIATQQQQLIAVYVDSSNLNIRAGIELALAEADAAVLQSLLDYGMPSLTVKPELIGLLGKTALQLQDKQALSTILIVGGGHMLVELTRQAVKQFSKADLATILQLAIDSAAPSTAAMMIAELAPYTLNEPGVGAALIGKLEHAELGSSAALALVQWGTAKQLKALEIKATQDPSSLLAKRVQTALSLGRNRQTVRLD